MLLSLPALPARRQSAALWGAGGVGRGAAMGRCRNSRTEKSEQAAAAASELPTGSEGNSQLPCKHRPSTQHTNLIMGGVPPPSWHIPHFFSSSSSSSALLHSLSLIVLIRQGWSGCQLPAPPLKGGGWNNLWIWSSNSIYVPVLTPRRGLNGGRWANGGNQHGEEQMQGWISC